MKGGYGRQERICIQIERTARVLKIVVSDSSRMGDLNARHQLWDSITNPNGRALVSGTCGNICSVRAPGVPNYSPRGRSSASSTDLVVTNFRTNTTKTAGEIFWAGVSHHAPLVCTFGEEDEID